MLGRIGRPAWLLLAFVLVAAQALGLMHRIVHAPHAPDGALHDSAHAHAGHDHGAHAVQGLFSGHEDDSTCRLFDPLNHDALPALAVLVLPLVLRSCQLQRAHGDFVARWRALFDARGPPALR